jgi:hypothetical protein
MTDISLLEYLKQSEVIKLKIDAENQLKFPVVVKNGFMLVDFEHIDYDTFAVFVKNKYVIPGYQHFIEVVVEETLKQSNKKKWWRFWK